MDELTQDTKQLEHEADRAVESPEYIVSRNERPDESDRADGQKPVAEKSSYDKVALVALIVSLIAWAILLVPSLYSGYVALGVAVLAVVLAALGLKSKRRGRRDLSTTALIIGGVLTVVILSFIVVIYVGLKGM